MGSSIRAGFTWNKYQTIRHQAKSRFTFAKVAQHNRGCLQSISGVEMGLERFMYALSKNERMGHNTP